MKKIISTILVLTMLLGVCATLSACAPEDNEDVSFVTVDINPTIEIMVKDGKVTAVYGANEDAQVLLYGEDGIVGESLEVALEKITSVAVELRYLTEDNKAVGISVSDENGANEDEKKRIADIIADSAEGFGITVTVCEADSFSVTRKLQQLREKYPDNETLAEIDLAKFRLALSASESGKIALIEAVEKTNEELLEIVDLHHSMAEQYATDVYNKASDLANAAYEKAYGMAMDAVYYQYLVENMLTNPAALLYSASYSMYMTSARGIEYFADCLDYVEEITTTPIPEEQIAKAADVLGVDKEQLEDSDGNVTVKSIEAYADKLFRNSKEGEELQELWRELDAILSETETSLRESAKAISETYKPEIEALIETSRKILETVETTVGAILPSEIKAFIERSFEDYASIANSLEIAINDGDITTDELRDISKQLIIKADAIEQTIGETLSEDDLEEIEKRQSEVAKSLSDEKAKLDEAIAEARDEAIEKLQRIKERKTSKS